MSRPIGSVPLTGYIYTTDDSDVFPTHLDLLGKGGYRVVDTISARDLITSQRRSDGMLVYVKEDLTLYQLLNSTTNTYTSVYQIIDNKPVFDITLTLAEGKIFVGDANNIAIESDVLSNILNSKFILEGEANNLFPNSKNLASFTDGYLYSENGILSTKTMGADLDLDEGKIFVGNTENKAEQSNILIDLLTTNFILSGSPSTILPNSVSLGSLTDGYLYSTNGVLSTVAGSGSAIPDLASGKVFVGNSANKAEATQKINYNNMPELGLAIDVPIPGVSHFLGQVYLGTESGVPERSSALALVTADVTLLNIWRSATTFILTEPNIIMPRAQNLLGIAGLTGGILKVLPGGTLVLAEPDIDYATEERLQEIQTRCEEAANAAEEAANAAEEAQTACEEIQATCEEIQTTCQEIQTACEQAQAACEQAQAACEAAQGAAQEAQAACEASQLACEEAQVACEAAQVAAELAQAQAEVSAALAAQEAAAATTAAATAAGSAAAAAGSAAAAAGSAGAAGTSAGAAAASAAGAAASAIAAGVSAGYASGYADDAEGYKNDAQRYKNHAEEAKDAAEGYAATASTKATEASTSATNALASETQAGLYEATCEGILNTILTTGLNSLPNSGDINIQGYKITDSADPVNDQDLVNLRTMNAAIASGGTGTVSALTGFVQGTSVTNGILTTTIGNASLDIIPASANVSLSNHKITSLADAENPTDAVNLQTMTAAIDLVTEDLITSAEGFVTSGAPVNGVMTFSRGSSCTLDVIPAAGNISITGYKVTGSIAPVDGGDLTNKTYVDTLVAGAGTVTALTGFVQGTAVTNGVLTTTIGNASLDIIPASANVSFSNFKITNLATPTNGTDGTNKSYVDSKDVTSANGFVTSSAPVNGVMTFSRGSSCTLDVIPAAGNISITGYKITGSIAPTNGNDLTNKTYVDTAIAAASIGGITSVTGFVEGTAPVNGVLTLSLTPADIDLTDHRIINLKESPENDFDATSTKFVWDLMNDNVDVTW